MITLAQQTDQNSVAYSIGYWVGVVVTIGLLVGLYALPGFIAFVRKPGRWKTAMVLDLALGWTVIGWIGAMVLAVLPKDRSPSSTLVSADGRWWWDGRQWQPR